MDVKKKSSFSNSIDRSRQIIIGAKEDGSKTGEYFAKEIGHTGEGKRHLAITVLLYNSKGEVLLQKRKHKIFDDIWDLTGATHPLHLEDGRDESFEEATCRCLEIEYGIKEKMPLKNLGSFNYFARYEQKRRSKSQTHFARYEQKKRSGSKIHFAKDGDLCEHEHCAMMVGEYNGKLNLNDEVGYEYEWMDKNKFLDDINKNPQKYTPWAILASKLL